MVKEVKAGINGAATGIQRVVYSPAVGDLFHYGNLQSLQFANSLGDYHVCGVLTDEAVQAFRRKPIANLAERKAVLESLNCLDKVMVQDDAHALANLKLLHELYPLAEIILVRGSDWKNSPEASYLQQIGGRIVQHPYYEGLSDFKIINRLFEHYQAIFRDFETFTRYFKVNNFNSLEAIESSARISTKAETLQSLQTLNKSSIERSLVFTVSEWEIKKEIILKQIQKQFSDANIVIRSSALAEDSLNQSLAGRFHSELGVNPSDLNCVSEAVQMVIQSYGKNGFYHQDNQVLIQKETTAVACSGVIFTRQLETNSPYYVINFDDRSGLTNTVTSGKEGQTIYVSRFSEDKDCPVKLKGALEAVKEIESHLPNLGLDIEFAVTSSGKVIIFQVRPLSVNIKKIATPDLEIKEKIEELKQRFNDLAVKKEHLAGETTIFTDMSDWNPAEILGSSPHYLDYSLYDYIITREVWHKARTSQGYYNVHPAPLVVLFGNKPYVDTRNSFNSFLPADLPRAIREKLVDFYLSKLRQNHHLQDKVEFEIAYTCYDLSFDQRSRELTNLSVEEIALLKQQLIDLTNRLVNNHTIAEDLRAAERLEISRQNFHQKAAVEVTAEATMVVTTEVTMGATTEVTAGVTMESSPGDKIKAAVSLLDSCKTYGTEPFSRLARLAFVGKALLRSLVAAGILTEELYHLFLASIFTTASQINQDFKSLIEGKKNKEEFLSLYGHLRPGTYDLTSLRYDQEPLLLSQLASAVTSAENKSTVKIPEELHAQITLLLNSNGLKFSSQDLFAFAKLSLEAREYSKFEFTKNLSQAMELIAAAGTEWGFSREAMAALDVDLLLVVSEIKNNHRAREILQAAIDYRNQERKLNESLILPSVIASGQDLEVVSFYDPQPNFITQKTISAPAMALASGNVTSDLTGKIILLEHGDPGYDWIFTKNPAGLITKYGGVASHMAIRCAEFALPAAIGCGRIFDSIRSSGQLSLDCKNKKIVGVN